jgi:hypothetical protein
MASSLLGSRVVRRVAMFAPRLTFAGLFLLLVCIDVEAQQKNLQLVKSGAVSGSIFLITKAGDLKPARMAQVYLFFHPKDDDDSAGSTWVRTVNAAMRVYTDESATAEGMGWSDAERCRKHLRVSYDALSATSKWIAANHMEQQVVKVDADENGTFEASVSRPGRYVIVAFGHAGMNDAFWWDKDVIVSPAATTKVKFSSPAEACLMQ